MVLVSPTSDDNKNNISVSCYSEGLIMELDSIKQFDAQCETDMHTISCCTGLYSQVGQEPSLLLLHRRALSSLVRTSHQCFILQPPTTTRYSVPLERSHANVKCSSSPSASAWRRDNI